jgi:hypothetical protein
MRRRDWDLDDDDDDYDIRRSRRRRRKKRQGGAALGIISFAIAIICMFAVFVLLIAAVVIGANGPVNDNDPVVVMLGLGIIGCMLAAVVGIVLGAVGAFQSNTIGTTCSIIGVAINTLILLGVLFVMCLGALAPH